MSKIEKVITAVLAAILAAGAIALAAQANGNDCGTPTHQKTIGQGNFTDFENSQVHVRITNGGDYITVDVKNDWGLYEIYTSAFNDGSAGPVLGPSPLGPGVDLTNYDPPGGTILYWKIVLYKDCPEPTNTPAPTATPTNTQEPTATPTNTLEPTATNTDEPDPTDTPEPTATPEPEPTDEPQPEATQTREPRLKPIVPLWLLTGPQGQNGYIVSETHPSRERQQALLGWVASNAPCFGWVKDNGTARGYWYCDRYASGRFDLYPTLAALYEDHRGR